ncbi:hypothetical protein ACTJI2_01045 [Pseudoxanthomonas sp. 22568]|uniref:hypothetical protein n=1 Tax=Pseudoxanthomonas sp. 22568 TaxID=3453945 RepID=UPI003F83FC5A
MDTERRGTLRWKHILTLAGIGALVLALFLVYNAGRATYEKHRQAKWEAKYANSLWPCRGMGNALDDFRHRVGAPVDFIVAIYPSFDPPDLIAISGNEVRFMALPRFPRERGTGWPAPSKQPPRKVALPPDLMSEVVMTLSEDVENARATPAYGLDGVNYVFFTASGRCGETWSPEENSRSGKLVDLVDALRQATRSPEGQKRDRATERVRNALKALQE